MSTGVMLVLMLLIAVGVVLWGYYVLVRKPLQGAPSDYKPRPWPAPPHHPNCRCKAEKFIVFEARKDERTIQKASKADVPGWPQKSQAIKAAQAKRIRRQERNRQHALAGAFRNQG